MKGIYTITCTTTGIIYVGSTTVDFTKRFRKHRQRLRHNYHENQYLQNAWNKYGENDFVFHVLEDMSSSTIDEIKGRESYYLSYYYKKGRNFCFNLTDNVGGGCTVHTEEDKEKLSQAVKKSYTSELRQKRREQALENKTIDKAREKINTPEWKQAHLEGVRKLAKDPIWLANNKKAHECRQVKVYTDLGEEFDSVAEAARQCKTARDRIRYCIKGMSRYSRVAGRKWSYTKFEL